MLLGCYPARTFTRDCAVRAEPPDDGLWPRHTEDTAGSTSRSDARRSATSTFGFTSTTTSSFVTWPLRRMGSGQSKPRRWEKKGSGLKPGGFQLQTLCVKHGLMSLGITPRTPSATLPKDWLTPAVPSAVKRAGCRQARRLPSLQRSRSWPNRPGHLARHHLVRPFRHHLRRRHPIRRCPSNPARRHRWVTLTTLLGLSPPWNSPSLRTTWTAPWKSSGAS